MADDGKPGIKDVWGTIKKSPALLITAIVGVLLVLYLIIKKGPSGQTQSTNSTLPSLTGQGSYIQPYIEPIIIPMTGNQPSVDGGSPGPTTGITMPPPSGGSPAGSGATTPNQEHNYAYNGLLGPNAQVDFRNRTYTNAQGQQVPLPIPASDQLVQGSQNRVWYTDGGGQHLLTSGNGPAIDARTNTPVQQTQSSNGTGTTNQQNSNTTINRNSSTIPANG